ncbi:hypothetical protein LZ31DRAFT_349826 [Colletotrichum somersetense]|nr:hypothetical protein LZ31DRAFT_349826 [Colletotrichum somersetense]
MQDAYIIVSLDEPLLTPLIEVFVAALAASRTVRYIVLSRCGKPCEGPGGLVPYMDRQCVLHRVVSIFSLATQSQYHVRPFRIRLSLLHVPSSRHVRWAQSTATTINDHMRNHDSSLPCREAPSHGAAALSGLAYLLFIAAIERSLPCVCGMLFQPAQDLC